MTTELIGAPTLIDMTRSEDDTNDVVVHLTNEDGTDAVVIGWTAVLSIGSSDDLALSPPKTFPGLGVTGGLIPINMSSFDVVKGSYKYDIRITDTVAGDAPARVYFKGKFKVTPRIN
jgi:hypothetical protein